MEELDRGKVQDWLCTTWIDRLPIAVRPVILHHDDHDDDDNIHKSREFVKFSGVCVNNDIAEMVNDENKGCLLTIDMGGNNF